LHQALFKVGRSMGANCRLTNCVDLTCGTVLVDGSLRVRIIGDAHREECRHLMMVLTSLIHVTGRHTDRETDNLTGEVRMQRIVL